MHSKQQRFQKFLKHRIGNKIAICDPVLRSKMVDTNKSMTVPSERRTYCMWCDAHLECPSCSAGPVPREVIAYVIYGTYLGTVVPDPLYT